MAYKQIEKYITYEIDDPYENIDEIISNECDKGWKFIMRSDTLFNDRTEKYHITIHYIKV